MHNIQLQKVGNEQDDNFRSIFRCWKEHGRRFASGTI